MGYAAAPLAERFWSKADRSGGPAACWPWTAARHRTGYGKFSMGHQHVVSAHRVAYELANGPIPDDLFVLHRCDNPPCVNPSHLFTGTHTDNVHDMGAKQRSNHGGSHNGGARLAEPEVVNVLQRIGAGEDTGAIAEEFGVHRETINAIRRGKSWKHIPRAR